MSFDTVLESRGVKARIKGEKGDTCLSIRVKLNRHKSILYNIRLAIQKAGTKHPKKIHLS